MLNNSQGVIGLFLGLKSRITLTRPLLPMLFMLVLGGWNSEAFAAWSGSGQGKNVDGTWYALYDDGPYEVGVLIGVPTSKTLDLLCPGDKLTFEARRSARSGIGTLRVSDGYTKLYDSNPEYDYKPKGSFDVNVNATRLEFKEHSASYKKLFKNIRVTMAQYLENPMKDSKACTKLDCGAADYLANSTNNSFTIAWCNVPAMTYKLSGDDADLFSVSISNNAEAGKWNTATITVTCNHSNRAGGHSATLEMKDTYGNYSKTITLSATTNKGTPSIDCSQVSASGLTYGQKLSASTISGQNATYKNKSYAGTYTWTRSDRATHTALGCTDYSVTFTPTDTNLNSVNCTIQVPMTKVAQTITWNQATKYFIDENATLSASTTGHDASVYFTSGDESIATINGNTVVMHKAGDVVITAHADATCNYNAASKVSHTLQFRNRPTLQWNKTGENDHIYASDTLAHLAYASYGNNTFNLPFEYSVSPAGVLIPTAKKDSLIANPELTQKAACIVTASFAGNETYCAINGTHTYKIEPKITPLFKLGEEDLPESPVKELKLKVGETANMTFLGTDESNNRFTYPTNAQYVSYTHNSVAHTGVITGTVAGDEVIQFHQTGTNTIFDHTRSIHVYVTKHGVTLSSFLAGQTYHVDDSIDFADAYSVSVTPNNQPAQEEVIFSSSNEKVVKLVNGKIKAVGAGEADLTFRMANNAYWTGDTIVAHVNIIKYDPAITWNIKASYEWGDMIYEAVSSTNEDVQFTVTSNNPGVANYVNGVIEVYNQVGSATFTVAQGADRKWNEAKTNLTRTITVTKPDNHVPYSIGDVTLKKDNSTVKPITGIPGTISYKLSTDAWAGRTWRVYWSATGNNNDYHLVEEYDKDQEKKDDNLIQYEEDLDPSTKYLKFEFDGDDTWMNKKTTGTFKDVFVSERSEIDAPSNYDFRIGYMGNKPTQRTIDVDWYNVKDCEVELSGANASQFELVTTSFDAELDQYGKAGIRVNYKHNIEGTHTATLTITSADIPAKTATITLTGKTDKAVQTMIWRDDITPIAVGKSYEKAVYATSGLDVTLTSENENIISVDGTTITGVSEGTTRLFVSQAGDSKWEAKNETIYVQVTAKKVQHIIWKDRLGNLKRENNQTVTKTLNAYTDEDQPITYELDNDARQFASVSGNTLTITGWGSGKITAHQTGTNGYVEVSKTMNMASRNPNEGCNPLVLQHDDEESIWQYGEKEYDLSGEPAQITFDAHRQLAAIKGLYVDEYYGGKWHTVKYNTCDNSYGEDPFGPYDLHRESTKIRFRRKFGATLNGYFKNVKVTTAKYLELVSNDMDFSSVDFGQVVYQEFYVDFSNISGVLDVELKNESEQFEIVTETLGDECGDINHYARVQVRFTGRTMGTEENTIVISNKDQLLEVPVSATVVKASQVITWNDANPANVLTTDNVVMSATATSGESVSFVSSDETIAETYDKSDGTWGLTIHKGGEIIITAKQTGNNNYDAAPEVEHTYIISRVEPTITTPPTASDLELPNVALSNSTLSNGEASVPGTFVWADETINAALGTNAYTVVFTPTDQNLYKTTTCEVNVRVLRAPQTITWNFDQLEMYCNADITFDASASSGLTVTYESADNKIAYVDNANKLRIIKGGEVTITAIQEGDGTYVAAKPVAKTLNIMREKPTVVTHPTATPMKIGKLRDNASLTGGRAELNGKMADGSFAWKNGGVEVENVAGSFPRTVIFTPSNSNYYDTVEFVMNVTVEKYAPEIAQALHGSDITYGQALSASNLSGSLTATDMIKIPSEEVDGTYTWLQPSAVLNAGSQSAKVRFTPANMDWYEVVDFPVQLNVNKASTEGLTVTGVSEIFYGQILGEAVPENTTVDPIHGGVVAGTMVWNASLNLNEYMEVGSHNLSVTFTVNDPNYISATLDGTAVLTVQAGYVFNGNDGQSKTWGEDTNWQGNEAPDGNEKVVILADVDIDSPVSVDAITIKEGVTVRVKEGAVLTIGNSDSFVRSSYGNLYVENGGKVIFGEGEMKVKDFVLEAQLGDNTNANPASSGQVSGAEQLKVTGDAYFRISFDPRGAIDYGWYDFTVPFEVDALSGVYDANGNKLTYNSDYAVMDFSEEKRAVNGKYWNWFSGTLQPNKLYSITFDDEKHWNTFLFKRKSVTANFGGDAYNASYSENGETKDRGWNGMGNGTLHHCQLNNLPAQTKIQVYDHAHDRYVERDADEYTYAVGTAFFVQVDEEKDVDLTAVNETRDFLAPARYEGRTFDEFRLALTAEDANNVADYLWVSASEEATGDYVIGRDLIKMGTPTNAKVAQMWTTNNGLTLCDIEMPLIANKANTNVSFFAPQSGLYEIAVERAPEDATLYLTKNGKVIWNLSMNPCELNLEKGTTEGYGLRIVAREQTPTDIENVDSFGGENVRKVMIDNVIYIVTPEGKMYDIIGKSVKY